ncbi:hypothetical protein NDI45_18615 [Leptolyngbya sp. GB1-A1]|uniref:hypothetical protein n=1 Tax=Leptolyngbya sp. GB1-A1 TaxID=2933908 RepID=UPI0032970E47
MASTDYYWSRVPGFGRMWFLLLPRDVKSSAGGESLLGSVVHDHEDRLFGPTGPFGKIYPEPNHLTTPQIILKAIEANHLALGIPSKKDIIQEELFPSSIKIEVEKKNSFKVDVGNFPGLPVSFTIDYSRMNKVTMEFGVGTRKRIIPTGFLSRLHEFYGGDDSRVPGSAGVNISKETIVHQILTARQYSVTFESTEEFKPQFQADIAAKNTAHAGRIKFALDTVTKKRVVVTVNDGNEYLIALNDIDWDKLD